MVQLASRSQPSCGTAQRNVPCRGTRSCVRSTAVRCFKGGSDDTGNKPNTALRLNFKIPYRVHFGQSLGLVGSGDSLGNWDPKRTVQMKWTDGDWWTVELTVSSGSSLDLEYKYVVVNADGNIGLWKPGSNYRVTLPLSSGGTKAPRRVKVADAWDDSFKKVDIEEAEVSSAAASSGGRAGPVNSPPSPGRQQELQQLQAEPRQQVLQQPSAPPVAAPDTFPAAASAAATAPPVQPANNPTPVQPLMTPTPATKATASSNGTPPAAQAPPSPEPAAAPAAAPAAPQITVQTAAGTATSPAPGVLPRATSPRAIPPSFAAATTIPVLHPSLLAEQERLEDGVRNSLEDLQAQMDKHQLLRERTDDPAAVEVLVADRIVAAANNRVVAYNKALKAVQEYNRLPPSASAPREVPSDAEK
ncbi:hypothetical protein PLESTB_001247900 [Pleodorina starrii]|uniref:CBM20 domain-containing protein n=1 Tax=Pleodorina starrii TaxID=330485 RepID=A0A9W6F6I2_9CHLO|nr:hypothetical protein PLESTM_000212100 [Pleodorina starrii]GLC57630.1 hypothetical protein PLESTB_001247900 [Pleodorina starrii]GLC63298.1 hypothetical protein PLESTF_000021500 [Pleodorina starrii]